MVKDSKGRPQWTEHLKSEQSSSAKRKQGTDGFICPSLNKHYTKLTVTYIGTVRICPNSWIWWKFTASVTNYRLHHKHILKKSFSKSKAWPTCYQSALYPPKNVQWFYSHVTLSVKGYDACHHFHQYSLLYTCPNFFPLGQLVAGVTVCYNQRVTVPQFCPSPAKFPALSFLIIGRQVGDQSQS